MRELKQETTGDKKVSKYDLFKDKDGNIYVKPKKDKGPGEPTGYMARSPTQMATHSAAQQLELN